MQSKNQVIILGTVQVFLKKRNRPFSQTVQPTEKEAAILLCCCCLDFKLYSLLLQCSGRVQSKNGVDLVEVSAFYKSEKMSSQTVRPIKIKTAAPFYLINLVFKLRL